MIELKTDRLLLRPFRRDDFDDVHAYASDFEVVRWMDWGPDTREETGHHVSRVVATASRDEPYLTYPWAAERIADGRVIGSAELRVDSLIHHRAEMGYVFARDAWGHGYATEAARAVLDYAMGPLGVRRVAATCDPDNAGSARVLQKIGMGYEGRMRSYYLIRGEWRDRLLFAAVG